jgi:hypothetical protein
MAESIVSGDRATAPDDIDVLLPDGWVEACLPQFAADGEEEPNVLRGLD